MKSGFRLNRSAEGFLWQLDLTARKMQFFTNISHKILYVALGTSNVLRITGTGATTVFISMTVPVIQVMKICEAIIAVWFCYWLFFKLMYA